jgi:hypothetical protein
MSIGPARSGGTAWQCSSFSICNIRVGAFWGRNCVRCARFLMGRAAMLVTPLSKWPSRLTLGEKRERCPGWKVTDMDCHARSLRCFVALAEELHFRRAARKLALSQPALSMRIRTLELQVGKPLFHRDSRHVTLTPAGEAFLAPVQAAIRCLDLALQSAVSAPVGSQFFEPRGPYPNRCTTLAGTKTASPKPTPMSRKVRFRAVSPSSVV